MGIKFYLMADGYQIAEAGRGTTKNKLKKLQESWWAKKHGGICGITEHTEPRAIYFAQQNT